MALVSKSDLVTRGAYKYTWTASTGDNPNITGKEDSGRVSKAEGYEVVDYMNAYAKKYSITGATAAAKLEDLVHASGKVMRADVTAYVKANW